MKLLALVLAKVPSVRVRYEESVSSPAKFWGRIASEFHWQQQPTEEMFLSYNFNVNDGPIRVEWMADGKTNVCYNCLDRHLEKRGDQVGNNIYSTLMKRQMLFLEDSVFLT